MPCIAFTKTTTCRDRLTIRSFRFYLGRVRGMLVRCLTLRSVEIGKKQQKNSAAQNLDGIIRTPCWIFVAPNFETGSSPLMIVGLIHFECFLFIKV